MLGAWASRPQAFKVQAFKVQGSSSRLPYPRRRETAEGFDQTPHARASLFGSKLVRLREIVHDIHVIYVVR
jgi:hypothetical protein